MYGSDRTGNKEENAAHFQKDSTARGGAQEDRFRPSCESPEQGRTLDPCPVRILEDARET